MKNQYFSKTINNKSNELILLSALQNIGLLFENTDKNNGSEFFSFNGTIIDYKINENENYPLTWYVLTSAIAANQNKNQNNYEPYVINDNENISSKLYFYNVFNNKILNDSASIENIIKEKDSINDNLTKNITVIDDVKTVFVGNDIFTSKPNDFDDNYNENQEEMINASILEITFENEEIAKKLTNNLFNLLKNSKNNYDLINFLKNDVYLKLSNTNEPNILDYHSFQNLISTSYELENLNFDNKTSMKEQIINKLNFYTSISNTKNQFIPAVDNIEFNDTNVPNFFELFFNKSDFITFNKKNIKLMGFHLLINLIAHHKTLSAILFWCKKVIIID